MTTKKLDLSMHIRSSPAFASPFHFISLTYVLIALSFTLPLKDLIAQWLESEEYGHGLLLSGIALYLLWLRRRQINACVPAVNVFGFFALGLSLILYSAAIIGDIQIVKFYTMLTAMLAIPLAIFSLAGVRPFGFPLLLLFFSIPFHPSINILLTAQLQLISTDIGVWFIRAMGMAALQEGNVIHMGTFILLVEEACSGLRYLLPLASISLLAAYYFKGSFKIKLLIFLSVVPITVMMNSLRIALTGLIIKYYGTEAAQGFLHDFEGIVVFASACLILAGVLAALSLGLRGTLAISKNYHIGSPNTANAPTHALPLRSAIALLAIITIGGAVSTYVHINNQEIIPERETFAQFPLVVDRRELYPDTLDEHFLNILKPDDYFIGDFVAPQHSPINLYMAYYGSQKQGSLIHSPSACIPAGGWTIVSSTIINLDFAQMQGNANRAIIEKGGHTLLVYYWVNQQQYNFAKDMEAQWSLIKRSTLYNRTDGTLVRVIVPMSDTQDANADQEIQQFISSLSTMLPRFLPQ